MKELLSKIEEVSLLIEKVTSSSHIRQHTQDESVKSTVHTASVSKDGGIEHTGSVYEIGMRCTVL